MTAQDYDPSLYTYDVRVEEYQGISPQGNPTTEAMDADEFKQPYMLWVPRNFTDVDGKVKDGHSVWTTEDGELSHTDIRANYYLFPNESPYAVDPAQILMTAVDGDLLEKGSVAGAGHRGVLHNGEDEDGDGKPDGYRVYRTQESDSSGEWRVVFTAEDPSGKTLRRNHAAQRMIPVNEKKWVHIYGDLNMQRLQALCFDSDKGNMPLLYPGDPYNRAKSAGRYFERGVRDASVFLPKNRTGFRAPSLVHDVYPDASLPVLHITGNDILSDKAPGELEVFLNSHFVEIKALSRNCWCKR